MLSLNEFNLKRLRFWLFSLLITFSFSKTSVSDESIPKVIVQLSAKKISINNNNLLAISFKNEPHWHTYWKNPGDAGLPIKVSDIDTGEQIESLEWPTPKRYIEPGDACFPPHFSKPRFSIQIRTVHCTDVHTGNTEYTNNSTSRLQY